MKRRWKKILSTMLLVLLVMFFTFVINGTIEYFIVSDEIGDFKSRGIYEKTEGIYSYYKVKKQYDYEDIDNRPVITNYGTGNYIGSLGDIILTNRNPLPDEPIIQVMTGLFAQYYYVGHASLNMSEELLIEVYADSGAGVMLSENNWFYDGEDTPRIVGLRVKNTNQDILNQVSNYAYSKLGYPYNWTFLFYRHRSFYCTDLVSRAYLETGISINYDNLATTGNDMIVSPNTYLIFYRELIYQDGTPHYNIYYLTEGE